jgi:ubiquinone/menaquinone biosynthesis C-methylase UbiE
MALHNANMWQRWSGLTEVVGGAVLAQGPDEMRRAFIGAMHTIGTSLAPAFVEKAQAGSARRLLDVGGASGTYTLAFLTAHPEMRATLFDLAPVIEMARDRIGQAGMLDRVALVPGDFHHDALPAGHDLAWVSAIIHSSTPAQIVDLLRNVHQALEPGGRVIIRDHILSPDRTHPLGGALFAVNMLTGTGGNSYTYAEIESFLAAAGFRQIRLLHPDTNMDGMIDARKEH